MLNLVVTYRQKYSRHDSNMSCTPKTFGHGGDIGKGFVMKKGHC